MSHAEIGVDHALRSHLVGRAVGILRRRRARPRGRRVHHHALLARSSDRGAVECARRAVARLSSSFELMTATRTSSSRSGSWRARGSWTRFCIQGQHADGSCGIRSRETEMSSTRLLCSTYSAIEGPWSSNCQKNCGHARERPAMMLSSAYSAEQRGVRNVRASRMRPPGGRILVRVSP